MVTSSKAIQTLVNQLSSDLDRAVLVDDHDLNALFWSPQPEVDPVRMTSILRNAIEPAALELVANLKKTANVVVTEKIAEIGMESRICAPLISDGVHIGYLWVLDPEQQLAKSALTKVRKIADQITNLLAGSNDEVSQKRQELISKLLKSPNESAKDELVNLENLNSDAYVVADLRKRNTDWMLEDGIAVRIVSADSVPAADSMPAASGQPLPLVQLGEAVRRARLVRVAIRAGAKLDIESFIGLQTWRLLLEAGPEISPEFLQPNFDLLTKAENKELFKTLDVYIDSKLDPNLSAKSLQVHRTTLYYRLGRISELLGVDFQNEDDRANLTNALRLFKIRQVLHA